MESEQCFITRSKSCGAAFLIIIFTSYTCRLGHGDIEEEQRSMPLRVETFLMLK